MAMRARGGGASGGSRPRLRPVAAVQPVYEDFKPISEWQFEDETDILLIYLPGFRKEDLKVSTEGRNIVRVYGERHVAGNKWNRFQEDFQAPENCNMRVINARFDKGILTIRMPRKSTTGPKKQQLPTPAPIPYPTPTAATPDTTQEEEHPQKTVTIPQKKATNDQLEPQENAPPTTNDYNLRDETSPKAAALVLQKEQEEERDLKRTQQAFEKFFSGSNVSGRDAARTVDEQQRTSTSTVTENMDEETKKRRAEKEKEDAAYNQEKIEQKYKQRIVSASSDNGESRGIGNYKQVVKSLAELSEERQLLVNMGVGVLVIVALGTYVSYSWGSGKSKL